eukprot:4340624-Alexandrium_andersonii.AAC.1
MAARGRVGPVPPPVSDWLREAGIEDPTTTDEWAHCLVAWRTRRRLQQRVRLRRRVRGPDASREPPAPRWALGK